MLHAQSRASKHRAPLAQQPSGAQPGALEEGAPAGGIRAPGRRHTWLRPSQSQASAMSLVERSRGSSLSSSTRGGSVRGVPVGTPQPSGTNPAPLPAQLDALPQAWQHATSLPPSGVMHQPGAWVAPACTLPLPLPLAASLGISCLQRRGCSQPSALQQPGTNPAPAGLQHLPLSGQPLPGSRAGAEAGGGAPHVALPPW